MHSYLTILTTTILTITASTTAALELTPDNYDAETAGKSVFLKFYAPWCGHCKKIKPDWDKLMQYFDGSASRLVGDVDCTAAGKPLCDANGVRGFPTLKYGDPTNLQDYNGGRSFDDLKKFAMENLKPICNVKHLDLCEEEDRLKIESYLKMDVEELREEVEKEQRKIEEAEEVFEREVGKLQEAYSLLSDEKEKAIQNVRDGGLGMMKSVLKSMTLSEAKDEL